MPVATKLRPAEFCSKKIYTHFEPQLDKIMLGTPQFQVFILFFQLRTHQDFGRKIAKLELEPK